MASNNPWADSVYSVASGLSIPMTLQGRRSGWPAHPASGLPIPPQSPATLPQSGLSMDQLDLDQLEPTNNWTSNQLQQLPDEHKSGKEAEYDALSVQGGEDPWKGSIAEDAGSSWTSKLKRDQQPVQAAEAEIQRAQGHLRSKASGDGWASRSHPAQVEPCRRES